MNKTTMLASAFLLFAACNNSRGKAPVEPVPPPPNATATAPALTSSEAQPGSTASAETPGVALAFAFEGDLPNAPPRGFSFARTGSGRPGRWVIQTDPGAPNGAYVLAQLDADATNFRFPVAVLDEPVLKDLRASVRCKMVAGRVDRACGIVVRYKDENNYYLTRANALEDNIRLYTVRDGKRSEIASHSGAVTPNTWHDYRLELRGDHFQIYWNGQPVLDHRDATFADAGRVGVWTKADSVTYFDDLRIDAP